MSHLQFVLQSCPNLQSELTAYFQKCATVEQYPFFEFLASPINETGLNQVVVPRSGKIRKIELRYTQRLTEDVVAENQPNPNCTATRQQGDLVKEYEIDPEENVQSGEKYDAADLERICRDNPTFFAERLLANIDVVDRKLATKHTQDAAALTGKWASDVSTTNDALVVSTLKSSGDIDPFTMQIINRSLQKTGYCDTPIIFGGDLLVDYYERIQAGCCANQGIDLSEILAKYGKAVLYDRRVATAFGGNDRNVVLQPKSLILLKYTRSGWKDGVMPGVFSEGSNYASTTIVSPRTGIPMDLTVKDDCGTIHFNVTATTKLVAMPDDMFHAGDHYEGVTFVNKIKVTNP
jgi:hypothetical protein